MAGLHAEVLAQRLVSRQDHLQDMDDLSEFGRPCLPGSGPRGGWKLTGAAHLTGSLLQEQNRARFWHLQKPVRLTLDCLGWAGVAGRAHFRAGESRATGSWWTKLQHRSPHLSRDFDRLKQAILESLGDARCCSIIQGSWNASGEPAAQALSLNLCLVPRRQPFFKLSRMLDLQNLG